MNDIVSVIIPFDGNTDYLEQCLSSVFQQTFTQYHVYLVSLGESEDCKSSLQTWKQSQPEKLSLVYTEQSFFLAVNELIAQLDTDYISVLPCDDYWADDFLDTLVSGLQAMPDIALAYSNYLVVNDESEELETPIIKPHQKTSIVDDSDTLFCRPWLALASTVFRKKVFDEIEGGFNADFLSLTAHVVWMQMASESAFYFCHEPLVAVRNNSNRLFDSALFANVVSADMIKVQDAILSKQLKLKPHAWLLAKCLQISQLTQSPLYQSLVMMRDGKALMALDSERTTINNLSVAVADIILAFTPMLVSAPQKIAELGSIKNAISLLKTVLDSDAEHEKAKSLLAYYKDLQLNLDYQNWIKNHAIQEVDIQMHAERMSLKWKKQPRYHFIVFLYGDDGHLLADTIDSFSQQFYPDWHLSVIADGPAPDEMFEQLEVLSWHRCEQGVDPYQLLNQRIVEFDSDYVSFIPAGMTVEPQSLLQFTDYFELFTDKKAFYSDDDLIAHDGERYSPRFKPDFNLEMLRSTDYIGVAIFDRLALIDLGGFDRMPAYENQDALFKLMESYGRDIIGHISDVLIHLPESIYQQANLAISAQVVTNHLSRLGIQAALSEGLVDGSLHIDYQHDASPLVSIIIPTRDKLDFLRPCIDSLIEKTAYQHYEVIVVDNESQDPDILDYFTLLPSLYEVSIKVIKYPHRFNYAAISNLAVEQAGGEYIVFLNNDVQVIQSQWLDRLLSYGQLEDVGAVGARLSFPETGLVQHVGVVLGMSSIADHVNRSVLNLTEPGYMGRAHIAQEYSAVTAACMLVSKALYQNVGGMDQEQYEVLYNDIDLCLRLNQSGHRTIWTPFSTLTHHTNVSITEQHKLADGIERGRMADRWARENKLFLKQWLPIIANDPSYNRHLSIAKVESGIESTMPCNWDVNFHDRQRILGLPLNGGSGEYRVTNPLDALSFAGLAQCEYYRFVDGGVRDISISEFARLAPDTIVFHAALNDVQLNAMDNISTYLEDVFCILTIDDLLTNVPEKSSAYENVKRHFSDAKPRLRKALNYCDRLVVSTQPLADLCVDMIDDIQVVPNRLKRDRWTSLVSLRNQSTKPRVGWAGAQQHQGDLEIIVNVVKRTADEIDWVFMGMCPEELEPYIAEYHDFVSIDGYPEKLASLNLDLAVAPLEFHPFNESKSNLRLLEYGVLGWPVICTDIYPYQTNNAPVIRINNEEEAWLSAIKNALANPRQLHQMGDQLKNWVLEHYILEDHLDEWLSVLVDKTKR